MEIEFPGPYFVFVFLFVLNAIILYHRDVCATGSCRSATQQQRLDLAALHTSTPWAELYIYGSVHRHTSLNSTQTNAA